MPVRVVEITTVCVVEMPNEKPEPDRKYGQ